MLYQRLDDWLQWLESLHPNTIDMGLERVSTIVQRLALDLSDVRVFTVGGTNGKGSCVATLEALLAAGGERVGVYTSPHFLRYNERVRVDGCEASDEQLCAAFDAIESLRGDIRLTYFEYGTLAALALFAQAEVSAVVLEVGLGGRLDAVNVVDPDVSIITSIDIDHQEWLGDNREDIGREKAGIFRSQRPAICADPNPPCSVIDHAQSINAKLYLNGRDFHWHNSEDGWQWQGINLQGDKLTLNLPDSPLPQQSIAAAIQAFTIAGYSLSADRIAACVGKLKLLGRCQQLSHQGRTILLDVAHNPAAAEYLVGKIKNAMACRNESPGKVLAVFAAMADKDLEAMLKILSETVDQWFFCGLADVPRAATVDSLSDLGTTFDLLFSTFSTVASGLNAAINCAAAEDRIVVLGSFYTVAAALQTLDNGA